MWRLYTNNVKNTIRNNATAYGYSILITMAVLVLNALESSPHVHEVFLAAGGAVVGFVFIELLATKGFTDRGRTETPETFLLGSSMRFFSVGFGVGAAALAGVLFENGAAWFWGSFVATLVYILIEAIELSGAEALEQ